MPNILIVDDSGLTRMQLKHALQNEGYEVFEASRGTQIIKNAFHPEQSLKDMDLVVLDLYLGDVNGGDVLKRIIAEFPYLPVIIYSVEKSREKIIECLDLGATDYMLKSFDRNLLVDRIKHILRKKDLKDNTLDMIVKQLHMETLRALRAGLSYAVTVFDMSDVNQTARDRAYQIATPSIREIDEIFELDHAMLFMFPLTNKEGEKIVSKKILRAWQNEGIPIKQPARKTFAFPDDLKDDELLKGYKTQEIVRLLINQLKIE